MTLSDIKNLVAQARSKEALAALQTWVASHAPDRSSEVTLLQGKLTQLQKQENMGLLGFQEANQEKTRINFALLNLIEELQPLEKPEKATTTEKTILFLAASPSNMAHLELEKEFARVHQDLQQAGATFKLVAEWNTPIADLQRAVLKHKPSIIHFSGHGSSEGGIFLENSELVDVEALSTLFRLANEMSAVDAVLLNACYSELQARSVVRHIPFVIGMNAPITDKAAISFAPAFYGAMANRYEVTWAFEVAKNQLALMDIPEGHIPQLLKK